MSTNQPITPNLISELRRLDVEASPGEWVSCNCGKCGLVMGELYVVANTRVEDGPESPSGKQQTADARLIAAARNALPALLDRIEELERGIAQVQLALAKRIQLYRESATCESIHGECQDLAIAAELEMIAQVLEHRFWKGGKTDA